MDKKNRYQLFCDMIDEMDRGVGLVNTYDSLLHDYDGVIMFQAESQLIKAIGNQPGITAAEIAKVFDKTNSACSQLIRKLKGKGWVSQKRNPENCREYNLFLTQEGKEIYKKHRAFEEKCYKRTFDILADVGEEEMESYIKIQKKLNQAFRLDVEESKNL